ncbi:MAG: phosphoglycerate kinase [Desulfovibrio sp.]|uniref:phosphoglycerate kinase n=1 Tax=Desulfovibrio sp. 7SRBS1 TaxID=3378064 RepID=UPI003B417690
MKFIDDIDVSGKRLFMRMDYNVPVKNGVIQDETRIVQSLPTLRHALDNGASLVLSSHLGKPKGKVVPELTLAPVAKRVGELLGMDVPLAPDCIGDEVMSMVTSLKAGQIIMLENLRFHEGETANDPEFAKALAKLGDIYVDDAFGLAHRAHASNVGVTQYAQMSCGGLLLKKEWEFLGKALHNPERPYIAVSGGSKVSTKMGILKSLIKHVDAMIIGGAMANTFLLAQGFNPGGSLVERDHLDDAKEVLKLAEEKGVTLHLPMDFILGKGIEDSTPSGTCDAGDIPDDQMALDVGPKTVESFTQALAGVKTVLWNGPVGVFENPAFAAGSKALAKCIAGLDALTIVGGGDTDALIHSEHMADQFDFISTGGGSFLEFMEGADLPAFKALKEAC